MKNDVQKLATGNRPSSGRLSSGRAPTELPGKLRPSVDGLEVPDSPDHTRTPPLPGASTPGKYADKMAASGSGTINIAMRSDNGTPPVIEKAGTTLLGPVAAKYKMASPPGAQWSKIREGAASSSKSQEENGSITAPENDWIAQARANALKRKSHNGKSYVMQRAELPTLKSIGWKKMKEHVRNNEGLKNDIKLNQTLFGQAINAGQANLGDLTAKELVHEVKRRKYIIMPDNKYRIFWDLAQIILLPYLAITIPIRVGFSIPAVGGWFAAELLMDLYFLIDIFINFLSAYTEGGETTVETDPIKVAMHYAKGWFLVDLISILPIDVVQRIMDNTFVCSIEQAPDCQLGDRVTGSYLKMFRMLRLMKLIKLVRLMRFSVLYERYQDELYDFMQMMGLAKIMILLCFLAHLLGCLWFFFGNKDWQLPSEKQQEMPTWIETEFGDDLSDVPTDVLYMASLYWAFTTMTTVGYGDITALSVAERAWAILAMIAGTFFFSYLVGCIVKEFESAYMQQVAFDQKMMNVRGFVSDMKMDRKTRNEVLNFFRTQEVKSYDDKELLFELPFDLRTSIMRQLYRELIVSMPLFASGDDVFITELCSRLLPVSLTKGTFVYRSGEAAKELFIISKGSVEVTDIRGSKAIAVLSKGSYFGEGICFNQKRRSETIRCRHNVNLLSIRQDEMDEVLSLFPPIREQMIYIWSRRAREFNTDQQKEENRAKSLLFSTEDVQSESRPLRSNQNGSYTSSSSHQLPSIDALATASGSTPSVPSPNESALLSPKISAVQVLEAQITGLKKQVEELVKENERREQRSIAADDKAKDALTRHANEYAELKTICQEQGNQIREFRKAYDEERDRNKLLLAAQENQDKKFDALIALVKNEHLTQFISKE